MLIRFTFVIIMDGSQASLTKIQVTILFIEDTKKENKEDEENVQNKYLRETDFFHVVDDDFTPNDDC